LGVRKELKEAVFYGNYCHGHVCARERKLGWWQVTFRQVSGGSKKLREETLEVVAEIKKGCGSNSRGIGGEVISLQYREKENFTSSLQWGGKGIFLGSEKGGHL